MVFLRSYDRNPKIAALMNYIVDGARGMGLLPLCEGVETEEHYEFLKKAEESDRFEKTRKRLLEDATFTLAIVAEKRGGSNAPASGSGSLDMELD